MIVVKFGGHAMRDEDGGFARAIAGALANGEKVVVVHGGGPQIDKALSASGIESKFVGGFRYTTPQAFDVVERVLVGEVGQGLATALCIGGVAAEAISGRTLPTLIARKKTSLVDGSAVELGQVGDVVSVNTDAIRSLLSVGKLPVLSPVAADESTGVGLNVNADLAAAAIAGAMDASSLIILTDVSGIYRNWPDKSSLISAITYRELAAMKSTFQEGMAPKVQAVLDAIDQGAKAVRIIDGTDSKNFVDALSGVGGTLVSA
jgi:acetylglutamate kinase